MDILEDDVLGDDAPKSRFIGHDASHRLAKDQVVDQEGREVVACRSDEKAGATLTQVHLKELVLAVSGVELHIEVRKSHIADILEEFLHLLEKNFVVEDKGTEIYSPQHLHNFALYLGGHWYSLTAREGTYNDSDPIGVLDVTISSDLILRDLLGITDLRSDKRIDFVGGIRGLGELKRRVDSGEMRMALALYPVTMQQIIDIADTGNIMPPKTTWFEPKLRSGLVIHKLDD